MDGKSKREKYNYLELYKDGLMIIMLFLDLRRCWKVPYIVYFCNLFAQKLDLIDLRVDEFEEAIIDDCGSERNIVVVHLLQKLLKPFINRAVE